MPAKTKTVHIEEWLHAILASLADEEDRSLEGLVHDAIIIYLKLRKRFPLPE